MADARLITSLERAVEASPDDTSLRLHLAELLIATGRPFEAVPHVAAVLTLDPASAHAQVIMAEALAQTDPLASPDTPSSTKPSAESSHDEFDWSSAEEDLEDVVPPSFVEGDDAGSLPVSPYDVEASGLRLADIGGMEEVKLRLDAAFLAPMRNPELRRLYGKSLRGGLLLYGPPGCGKTFLAKALAGEMEARFLAVSLADVLDMYIGQSERNLRSIFDMARRNAPCVVFLDEIDAVGHKRTNLGSSGLRGTVNQLLTELDGVRDDNDGVFVLGATNHPWDIDEALRRPGRLDRTLLVLPPDQPAREAIFRHHLSDRPVESVDVRRLAKATDGFSGADIAHICETAAELALVDSAASGIARMIGMADLESARSGVHPSLRSWFDSARNVALFANGDGMYDDLLAYMRSRRLL